MALASMEPQTPPEPRSFRGLRVGVVGLGVEGMDIVRFLQAEGAAEIVVSDRRKADSLQARLTELAGIPLRLVNNDPKLVDRIDALFVSQGIPTSLPLVQSAHNRGLPVTSMMRHFLHRCPVPAIGITGSAGKTTTTTLVGEMFRAAERKVFVGGNIGTGPLAALPTIDEGTDVVLEISHTQLARTNRSPHLAAVLNVTPNHLDQFSWDDYVDLKRNLVRYQSRADIVVLPTDDEIAAGLASDTPARLTTFGITRFQGPGATVAGSRIVWHGASGASGASDVCDIGEIQVPGEHNLYNVLAAVAIGGAWGLDVAAMARAIREFQGVPHRLQTVAEIDGVRYIDDSIATAPERTVAALLSLDQPIVLLLGGREKRLPFDTLADEARTRCRAVICFGEAGPIFADALQDAWQDAPAAPPVDAVDDLRAAVAIAHLRAQSGDAVLLAPAGTSFDAYVNFEARGEHFAALAQEMGKGGAGGTH